MADSHLIQLTFALLAGVVFFVILNFRFSYAYLFLVLLIPFQVINSRYGSLNFALSIVFWIVLVIRVQNRNRVPAPLAISFMLILMCMLPALYGVPRFLLKSNIIYIIDFAQNFIMTMLAVYYLRDEERMIKFFYVLSICNVFVLGFFVLQAAAARVGGIAIMGITEFAIDSALEEDYRMLGPFGASQPSVAYLIYQSMFCMYALSTFADKYRHKLYWIILLSFNVGFIIATGTRAGFLGFCLALLFMYIYFVPRLGAVKAIQVFVIGVFSLVVMSLVVVNYTRYNTMFDRLKKTEIEGFEVDTRKGLVPVYWEQITKRPVFGHRPMLSIPEQIRKTGAMSLQTQKVFVYSPPHNYYLYVLFTTGFVGLAAHLLFLLLLFGYLFQAHRKWNNAHHRLKSLPALFIALMANFLIMQYFISYTRAGLADFQDYMFTLFGMMIALSFIAKNKQKQLGHA
jgi:O-antigen ligase